MTRKGDDRIEELNKWRMKREVEDGVRKGLNKWAHTICMTATSAVMTALYSLGGFVYSHWSSFEAAIRAYLAAERGGQ
jgi:hypothetical protein